MNGKPWTEEEIKLIYEYAPLIYRIKNHMSYYRACKILIERINRSSEAIRGQLKKAVNRIRFMEAKYDRISH